MKSFMSIIFLAAMAAASPATVKRTAPSGCQDASDACGSQVISCCNTSDKTSSSGLVSALNGPILSGNCIGVSVTAIALLNGITNTGGMCGDNSVSCCSGNKDSGLIVVDAQCTAL